MDVPLGQRERERSNSFRSAQRRRICSRATVNVLRLSIGRTKLFKDASVCTRFFCVCVPFVFYGIVNQILLSDRTREQYHRIGVEKDTVIINQANVSSITFTEGKWHRRQKKRNNTKNQADMFRCTMTLDQGQYHKRRRRIS